MIIFTVTEKIIDLQGQKIKRRLMPAGGVQKWSELLYFKSESAISTIG